MRCQVKLITSHKLFRLFPYAPVTPSEFSTYSFSVNLTVSHNALISFGSRTVTFRFIQFTVQDNRHDNAASLVDIRSACCHIGLK